MWSIEKFTKQNEWEQLDEVETFGKAESFIKSSKVSDGMVYVFWNKDYPSDKKEMEKVMEELFSLNKGNEIRVFPNAKTTVETIKPLCDCPSRCFCEWENGRCSCWTSYCRPNGCNWVRCNGSC